MLAFTDTIKTRKEAIAEAAAHQKADRFIQGDYWNSEEKRGCSVGCMTHAYREKHGGDWHEAEEKLYGIPKDLAFLQDRIFEGLPVSAANKWTLKFFKAIPQGADLRQVKDRFLYWLMIDPEGIRKHARRDGLKAIETVAELYRQRLSGKEPSIEGWVRARKAASAAYAAAAAADDAAASAAAAAYDASAAYAAAAAADDAASAAAAAADDAAYDAAAYDAARKKFYQRMAHKMLEIIAASPVEKLEGRQ